MIPSESQEEQERRNGSERDLVADYTRRAYRLLLEGSHALGGLEIAAGVCGVNAGDLRRSFDRDGRRLALDHAIAIAARLHRFNPSLVVQIGSAIVRPLELVVFPRVTMSDKERADRLEAKLRTTGQALGVGDQLVEDALR